MVFHVLLYTYDYKYYALTIKYASTTHTLTKYAFSTHTLINYTIDQIHLD